MTTAQVAEMIDSIGLPNAYYQFTNRTDVAPPFIAFYYPESMDFEADNINYLKINQLIIELYTDNKELGLEKLIETKLNENDLVFTRSETYLGDERMYMVVFSTSVIITEE